jgi:RNase H-fold protein (predicted Holliday junction resolvase)
MRFLGIDYGQRRIGLAISDATGLLARPWKTLARQGNPSQVAAGSRQRSPVSIERTASKPSCSDFRDG